MSNESVCLQGRNDNNNNDNNNNDNNNNKSAKLPAAQASMC